MVLVGVVLRVIQWAASPSLWLDELMLAGNVLDRGPWELLTQGLDDNQVAPVGYLFLTKIAVLVFGDGERALRLVPVAASLLALVLFWRLASRLFGGVGTFVAATAFALNPLLISLSSVVKQYGPDVLATVLVLTALQSLWSSGRSPRARILIGAGAGGAGFLSIPSIMVAAPAIGALLLHHWGSGRLKLGKARWAEAAPLVAWAVVAAVAALWSVAVLPPSTREYMTGYWAADGAFAPAFWQYPTWVLDRWGRTILMGVLMKPYVGVSGQVGDAFNALVGARSLLALLALAAVAIVRLRGPAWGAALLLPFFLALLLAALRVYPMDERTSSFLVPPLLLLVVAPVSLMVRTLPRSARGLRTVFALLLPLGWAATVIDLPPVYVVQRERDIVRELAQRRSDGQPVLVDGWARPAVEYYGPRFGLVDGVRFMDHDLPADLASIDEVRGERSVWVIFTHADNDVRDILLCYLDRIGREAERLVLVGGMPRNPVSLHRYDLSDETLWDEADPSDLIMVDTAFSGSSPCGRQPWSTGAS